jgi:hypothetical protein
LVPRSVFVSTTGSLPRRFLIVNQQSAFSLAGITAVTPIGATGMMRVMLSADC